MYIPFDVIDTFGSILSTKVCYSGPYSIQDNIQDITNLKFRRQFSLTKKDSKISYIFIFFLFFACHLFRENKKT